MFNSLKLLGPVCLAISVSSNPAFAELSADTKCVLGETVMLSAGDYQVVIAPDDGEVMLTMNGIDSTVVTLTEAQFAALPQYAVATENEHLDGINCYEGPLGRDIMTVIGAKSEDTVNLTAINDYWVEMPVALMQEYDVIFARSVNGEALSVRDKGPIWVMVPQTDNAELRDPFYSTYMVWQLNRVDLN